MLVKKRTCKHVICKVSPVVDMFLVWHRVFPTSEVWSNSLFCYSPTNHRRMWKNDWGVILGLAKWKALDVGKPWCLSTSSHLVSVKSKVQPALQQVTSSEATWSQERLPCENLWQSVKGPHVLYSRQDCVFSQPFIDVCVCVRQQQI